MTLQRRLLLMIALAAPVVWALTAALAGWRAQHEIDELYDTELVRLARQVATLLPGEVAPRPVTPGPAPGGSAELRTMSVALFQDGRRVLSDAEGADLPWLPEATGFVDLGLGGRRWRAYYLRDPADASRTVAVGQDADERDELVRGLLYAQLLPWLLMLPVLLGVLVVAVRRALAPLRRLSHDVERRDAADLRPIGSAGLPAELVPLASSIDRLLARVDETIRLERRFTADAAHELRTPLAALRAQWDAARLAGDPAARREAEFGVARGIDRLGHLVAQMLAMARADAAPASAGQPIDWRDVVSRVLDDTLPLIEAQDAQLEVDWPQGSAHPLPLSGDPGLVASMLRNLVDNAVRYGPRGGAVRIALQPDRVLVEDQGPGLDPGRRAHLGERFHRDAGSAQDGSGLGVSIAMRVATLHGLSIAFEDTMPRGLRVTVARTSA